MEKKKGVRKDNNSRDDELSSDFVEEKRGIRMIKVTKLPDGALEETLINYFENVHRNGGGIIECIEHHPETSSAIIKFQEAEAVDRVLRKRPLLFLNKQISVEKVEADEEEQTCHTIEVHGFAENTGEDVLEMYFENTKRSGGGEVTSVVIEDGVALVTFTDEKVASSVCERQHTLVGRKLKVSLHLPKKKSFAVEGEKTEGSVWNIKLKLKKLKELEARLEEEASAAEAEYSSMRMALKANNYSIVAAIHFGTDYSGYAFQFKHEFEKDPTKLSSPQSCKGWKRNLISYKTPTCLLLDKSQKVHSFGFEAEDKYAELCMDGENSKWYYFRRFKMKVQEGEGPKKDSKLQDETGKIMSALQVFSLSIQCLTNHLIKMLDKQGTTVKKEEIHWVLTAPAMWTDSAKLFMRTAAEQAGISSKDVEIVLEPDAASLYCQYLPVDKLCTQKGQVHFGAAPVGTKYMVLDLGGCTAVITIHEKLTDCKLKEIAKASGGPWGGKSVDNSFFRLLRDIVGDTVMTAFQEDEMNDYLDLMREFESVKRNLTATTEDMLTITLPNSILCIVKDKRKCTMKDCVEKSAYRNQIKLISDKMRIDPELVRDLFRQITDKIVSHVESSLKTNPGVSMILMVGGFSESGFVQDVIRSKFQDNMGLNVIVPREAGLSILNGAVIFGWMPEIIEPTGF